MVQARSAILRHWKLALALVLVVFAITGPPLVVPAAERYNRQILASAIATYGTLRAINAALSTAKETSVGVEIVGSVTAKPAMILDPVDETVARISGAVFVVAAISVLLEIALAPIAQRGAGLGATGLVVWWLAGTGVVAQAAQRLTVLGVGFAIVLPAAYATSGALGTWWTEARLEAEMARLRGEQSLIIDTVEPVQPEVPPAVEGDDTATGLGSLFTGARGMVGSVVDGVRSQADRARASVPDFADVAERGEAIVEAGVTIIAVHILRLVVLPILTLWGLWLCLGRVLMAPRPTVQASVVR